MLALCLRNIWLITATHDIALTIDHIRSKSNNIADLLSRIYSDEPVDQNLLSHLANTHMWRKIPIHFVNLNISILFQVLHHLLLHSCCRPAAEFTRLTELQLLLLISSTSKHTLHFSYSWTFPSLFQSTMSSLSENTYIRT